MGSLGDQRERMSGENAGGVWISRGVLMGGVRGVGGMRRGGGVERWLGMGWWGGRLEGVVVGGEGVGGGGGGVRIGGIVGLRVRGLG